MKGGPAELSAEDALRLQVLVTNAEAVRIDESAMVVYGLQGGQEMQVKLNPTCYDEKYLRLVRQMLSGTVLGSPGGYPVFLRRWTRMGEITNAQLDKLLMLGEPEATLAVARAPTLTEELARKAWWAAAGSELGRCMLENPAVVATPVGTEIAEYLLEYLPFETEHRDMVETVRLVLQPGLLPAERRRRLWDSGRMKSTYGVGFLFSSPEELPEQVAPRGDFDAHRATLEPLVEGGNPYAALLLDTLGAAGQSFLAAAEEVIRRPANQDVVSAWLNAVGGYFASARGAPGELRHMEDIFAETERLCQSVPELGELLGAVPELEREIRAAVALAHVDEAVVTPIFALTDAVGSLMRKKMEPVIQPILRECRILRGGE